MSDDISELGRYKLIDQIVSQLDRIEQLEAAWERDQSVIEEQRQEIGKLKSQINQLLQERRALRDKANASK